MKEEVRPAEEIETDVRLAGDSANLINNAITSLADGAEATYNLKDDIWRNVEHLKIITRKQDVIDSGLDISHLEAAITAGEAKLDEDIWPAEEE